MRFTEVESFEFRSNAYIGVEIYSLAVANWA